MPTEHEQAVSLALKVSNDILTLFGKAGTSSHPRGAVLTSYRTARRSLANSLSNFIIALEILSTLKLALRTTVWDLLNQGLLLGQQQSAKEAEIYGLPNFRFFNVSVPRDAAFKSVMARLDAQLAQVEALILSGFADSHSLILGDHERVGMLTPKPIIDDLFFWITSLVFFAWQEGVSQVEEDDGMVGLLPGDGVGQVEDGGIVGLLPDRPDFVRQSVAVIDNRTTDCCLRVHGQVAELDKPFKLTGTPRFADEMMNPPYHYHCRTTVALVRRVDADDDLTKQMKDDAKSQRGLNVKSTRG